MTTYAAASSGARWLAESRALPERLLSRLWRARTGRRLTATDGRRVEVLYPGRPAPGHGPDFRDAVLAIDGAPVRGDVEVHRAPSGWQAHGHGADASYDRVVLHVVGKDGPGGPSPDTPTVVVGSRPGRPRRSPPRPCSRSWPPWTTLRCASACAPRARRGSRSGASASPPRPRSGAPTKRSTRR